MPGESWNLAHLWLGLCTRLCYHRDRTVRVRSSTQCISAATVGTSNFQYRRSGYLDYGDGRSSLDAYNWENGRLGNPPTKPNNGHSISPSRSSGSTATQQRHQQSIASTPAGPPNTHQIASPMRLSGFVGLFTGFGALLALVLFLPLPAFFRRHGQGSGLAIAYSFYLVGGVALVVSVVCVFGLRGVEVNKTEKRDDPIKNGKSRHTLVSSPRLLYNAVALAFKDSRLALAYLGGFVARGSSVGISLFIPLYVNAYFVSSGLCEKTAKTPEAMNEQCRRVYILAAELTGLSQLVALLCAPIFGYLADRKNLPLVVAASAGVLGYAGLAMLESPEPHGNGSPWVFAIMCGLGISQIGAIVCSLGLLGRCVLEDQAVQPLRRLSMPSPLNSSAEDPTETSGLLERGPDHHQTLEYLKGSIAGIYSLTGGAGILLLTKLGGYLFDESSPSAPFIMLSVFNGVLLVFGLGCALSDALTTR